MSTEHNHQSKSPYKLQNELEKLIQDNYSNSILNLSKAIITEVDKELKDDENS